jgi:hypothetical protein
MGRAAAPHTRRLQKRVPGGVHYIKPYLAFQNPEVVVTNPSSPHQTPTPLNPHLRTLGTRIWWRLTTILEHAA